MILLKSWIKKNRSYKKLLDLKLFILFVIIFFIDFIIINLYFLGPLRIFFFFKIILCI